MPGPGEYEPEFLAAVIASVLAAWDPDVDEVEAFNTILPQMLREPELSFEFLVEVVHSVRVDNDTPIGGVWN